MAREIKLVDTTLRDGNQSLWALNMSTGMMLSALPHLDDAGFEAMEFTSLAGQMKKMASHMGQDAFEWLKQGTKRRNTTALRLHGGTRGGLAKIPLSAAMRCIEIAREHGITVTRTSNPWNDFEEERGEREDLRQLEIDLVMNVIYSESPRHTNEYFIERTKGAVALNPWRICFKDVGGLLTPERTRELVPLVLDAAGDIPVEFHAHSNNGLSPINVLEAAKAGIEYIHTGVPPLANGSGQPSVFNVTRNLRALGFEVNIHEEPLRLAEQALSNIARVNEFPVGAPLEYDYYQYLHQVPGGMISNLRYQLHLVGMGHRIEETLQEAIRVRAEFGYPIMVTPLSQFVGTQAAINIITGERYAEVSDQVIQYALGYWGKEPVTTMDQEVRAKILNRGRAREWAKWEQPQPTFEELRHHYGENTPDEEVLLRVYAGDEGKAAMGRWDAPEPYLSARQGIASLIKDLVARRNFNHIAVNRNRSRIALGVRPHSGKEQDSAN